MSKIKKDIIKLNLIYIVGSAISVCLKSKFLNNQILGHDSILIDNIILSSIFGVYIFCFSYFYDNNNYIDIAWGNLGIFLTVESFINESKRNSLYTGGKISLSQAVLIITLLSFIIMYSLRHLLIYYRHFPGFDNLTEDFRYHEFRISLGNKSKFLFWSFSLINLHVFPMVALALAYHPVFYSLQCLNKNTLNLFITIPGFILTFFAIFFETAADEQLNIFRARRKVTLLKYPDSVKVLDSGLWGLVRHPNYLGEILYFFGLFVFNLGLIMEFKIENFIGFLLIFSLFAFYSVGIMEKLLLGRYKEEYKQYQKKVKYALIPLIY